MVQVMPDLVDSEVFRLRQFATGIEGVFFEEEPYLIAGCQKVVVPNMVAVLAR
jgi:hypothetical protein